MTTTIPSTFTHYVPATFGVLWEDVWDAATVVSYLYSSNIVKCPGIYSVVGPIPGGMIIDATTGVLQVDVNNIKSFNI